jgi:hypothetical protein
VEPPEGVFFDKTGYWGQMVSGWVFLGSIPQPSIYVSSYWGLGSEASMVPWYGPSVRVFPGQQWNQEGEPFSIYASLVW